MDPRGDRDEKTERIGEVVDARYRITAAIGRGGMGRVYRAEHVSIKRPVALKVLNPEFATFPELNERFKREAFATGRVDHPNCVAITDSGTLGDGTTYLVMELLEGVSLADEIDDNGRMEPRRALRVARHVLRGLAHAHRAGVVHRDLKPENIFLVAQDGDRDFAKILDFGIAKLVGEALSEAGGQKLTQAGLTVGSPSYMSPEQASGDDIDGRSDLYSLTILLFEMLTGKRPFEAENKMDVVRMHLLSPPPSLAEVVPDSAWPPPIEKLVARGLAKRPADRFADADEYLAAIDDALRAAEAPPAPAPAPAPPAYVPTDTPLPVAGAVATLAPPLRPQGTATPPPSAMITVPRMSSSGRRRVGLWLGIAGGIAAVSIFVAVVASDHEPEKAATATARPAQGEAKKAPAARERKPAPARPAAPVTPAPVAAPADQDGDSGEEEDDIDEETPEAERTPASPADLMQIPELAQVDRLLAQRRARDAEKLLGQLRAKHPKNAYLAYRLGQVYFARLWWRDGFEQYRAAIRLDPSFREKPDIIRDAIRNFSSRSRPFLGRDFLVQAVGEPALPYLRETAARTRNPRVRNMAQETIRRIEAGRR